MNQQKNTDETAQSTAPIGGNATDEQIFENVRAVVAAAADKKAQEILVLRLAEITSFTDYFIICSGNSTRQVQAIADAVSDKLKRRGVRPMHTEGYANAEWVLIDYGIFVVHIFTEASRRFYDLERLWRDAMRVEVEV
ncbi:MAG: ribosome silencing factor [Acidobacteria bacterium]|nr:ribosome silencing factor [Acidobacteriota bacterium]MCW5968959.1 ribosome silencing factor [Blastocatellales bacterium]